MVRDGQLSVKDFVRKIKPVVETQEFTSNKKVSRNIKSMKEGSRKSPSPAKPQQTNVFDAESICKRRRRMQKIE